MGLFGKFFGANKKSTNFISSDGLMDEDRFWKIIKSSRDKANGDYAQQQDELTIELRKLTPDDIILFANRFYHLRGQANTWELWGAIYLIHGGCSDDSFLDFRGWMIAQGKDFYYQVIRNPESLVEVETSDIEDVDWEGFGYIPAAVFEELTGQELPLDYQENFETTGEEWREDSDDLKKRFPKLYAKYSED